MADKVLAGWSWSSTKLSVCEEFSPRELVDEVLYSTTGIYRTVDDAKRAAEASARSSAVTDGIETLPDWQPDGEGFKMDILEGELVLVTQPLYWQD